MKKSMYITLVISSFAVYLFISIPRTPELKPVNMPTNGYVFQDHRGLISENSSAGIYILTSGEDATVIKIEDAYTKAVLMTFFVRPGRSIEYTIPSGTYIIKVASGPIWYGRDLLFGDETYASQLEGFQVFLPTEIWNYELFPQTNGNQGQVTIDAQDF